MVLLLYTVFIAKLTSTVHFITNYIDLYAFLYLKVKHDEGTPDQGHG